MKKCNYSKCQKDFEPNKPKQIFCSDKCRVYGNREKKATDTKVTSTISNIPTIKYTANDEPAHWIKPILSPIEEYRRQIIATTYSDELRALMSIIKGDKNIGWKGQNNLEFFAQEYAKENFTY